MILILKYLSSSLHIVELHFARI